MLKIKMLCYNISYHTTAIVINFYKFIPSPIESSSSHRYNWLTISGARFRYFTVHCDWHVVKKRNYSILIDESSNVSINIRSPVVLPACGDKLTRDQNKWEAREIKHYHSYDRHMIADREVRSTPSSHMRRIRSRHVRTLTQNTQANFRHFVPCHMGGLRRTGPSDYARPPWKVAADALRTSTRSPRLSSALDELFLSIGARPSPRLFAGRRGRDPWSWDLLPFFSRGPLTCACLRAAGPSLAWGGIPRGSRLSPESLRARRIQHLLSSVQKTGKLRIPVDADQISSNNGSSIWN